MITIKTILVASAAFMITATACTNSDKSSSRDKGNKDSVAATAKKDSASNNSGINSDGTAGTMVGGAMMTDAKDIVDNAASSKDLSTFEAAMKQAGMIDILKGPGPFTIFAPTNAAFDKLDKATWA